jgi:hypothetical protein
VLPQLVQPQGFLLKQAHRVFPALGTFHLGRKLLNDTTGIQPILVDRQKGLAKATLANVAENAIAIAQTRL